MKALPLAILLLALWHPGVSAQPAQPASANGDAMELNVLDADPLAADRARAEQGDAKAQQQLGMMYYLGQGMDADYAAAHEWLDKAATQGDDIAQLTVGVGRSPCSSTRCAVPGTTGPVERVLETAQRPHARFWATSSGCGCGGAKTAARSWWARQRLRA